ncbi:hypothetical protein EV356DRAFT_151623 [Viridothelium virens]|uniref:Metallo-beta-lactamase domain-containing protein n=1 Tax=Viridothelium virens TaxID=1048519 RepID=A0A6A6H8U1_VIRVR|nr:hypothetical protein EV356DRAFT_151623 [Viridothelium virens]
METSDNLLVCKACATQFDIPVTKPLSNCKICDDPRQFVPPQGQEWTSLRQLKHEGYTNKWQQDAVDKRVWSIWTEPKFGIGQRAILLETEQGNVLWDCIALLDKPTVDFIASRGGLQAICISHPHYYTAHLDWARTFDCPVFIAVEDEQWCCRADRDGRRRLITSDVENIHDGVTAVKLGGHFPGSLVLHWEKKLFIADTFVTVPSGLYHVDRPSGTTSFSFMWSIPNMIPLPPSAMHAMWKMLKSLDFDSTHGAFVGMDIRSNDVKKRVLESMKIQTRGEGHENHALLGESL